MDSCKLESLSATAIERGSGMDRIITRRLLLRGATFALLAVPVGALAEGTATAAPSASPTAPTAIVIRGEGLAEPLTVAAAERQREFEALLSEVDWLVSRPGVTRSPAVEKLGPKYTVEVQIDGVAKQQYDLYPLATGGPRAYRSDKQPDKRKVTAGWFYGHLSMPTTLAAAGVPLPGVTAPAGGGGGGSAGTDQQNLGSMVGQWRGVVALNGVVVLVIAAGLFTIAFGIRRKV